MTAQSLSNYKSNDKEISRAIELITRKLTANEVDSFYVSEIDKSQDSIDITLFHYDLMKKLKEHKNQDDQWVVLPPITAMPDWTKRYTYSIKDDHLIEDPPK